MDELDDLFNAEEPNDESYHDNTNQDQMNLDPNKKNSQENIEEFNIESKPPYYPAYVSFATVFVGEVFLLHFPFLSLTLQTIHFNKF